MDKLLLILKGVAAFVGGGIVYWLGGLDNLLVALLAVLVLDYATGLLAAAHNKELSSAIGWKGIVKKVITLIVVALAYVIDMLTGDALPLREIAIMFFVVNEGLSILENAAKTGLPIPKKIRDALLQLRGKGSDATVENGYIDQQVTETVEFDQEKYEQNVSENGPFTEDGGKGDDE